MTAFMNWLRVELLRLRSFDWGTGTRTAQSLKDGVAKFSSFYAINNLSAKIGVSEEEILTVMDSPTVIAELEGKSFTLSWSEGCITLSWLEEGISQWKTEIDHRYYEEAGKYYTVFRMKQKLVYLDGAERIVTDMGDDSPIPIPEEVFKTIGKMMQRGDNRE